MPLQAILDEVELLHSVSARLESLAEKELSLSDALMSIAMSVRNTALLLAVVVATKSPKPI